MNWNCPDCTHELDHWKGWMYECPSCGKSWTLPYLRGRRSGQKAALEKVANIVEAATTNHEANDYLFAKATEIRELKEKL